MSTLKVNYMSYLTWVSDSRVCLLDGGLDAWHGKWLHTGCEERSRTVNAISCWYVSHAAATTPAPAWLLLLSSLIQSPTQQGLAATLRRSQLAGAVHITGCTELSTRRSESAAHPGL